MRKNDNDLITFSFLVLFFFGVSLKKLAKVLLKSFLPPGTSTQANKISLIISAVVLTGKKELV